MARRRKSGLSIDYTIQETYGEDPYLSGQYAGQYVRGLQGNHIRYVRASAGCKHFDVHGGPENIPVSRFRFDSKVNCAAKEREGNGYDAFCI